MVNADNNLPAVFQLRPLNNCLQWNNQSDQIKAASTPSTKILNNVCQCNCHQCHHNTVTTTAAAAKSDNDKCLGPSLDDKMARIWPLSRMAKHKLLILVAGLVCFILGLAIPFLLQHHSREQPLNSPNLKAMIRQQRPLLPIPHKVRDNTLENVFISVKTTHKFHYPRLIIQLETWVSLVKSQVSVF
jgi:hypothetical protein